ncbi:MAG: DUF177 domain-containing protein [Myxococcota bacterium]
MKLLVDRITSTPKDVEFEASPDWWAQRNPRSADDEVEVLEPFVFELRVSSLGEDVLIEGVMTGAIRPACSRCDERYRQPLRETLRLVLEPAGERVPAEPESAQALARDGLCLGDELEMGWYRGHEIHLDGWCAEVIALSFPMQPMPAVDENGRCSVCGEDRSQPLDAIEFDKPESPFAVLAALREDGDGGGA